MNSYTYTIEPSESIVWNGERFRIKSCQFPCHIDEIVLISFKKQFSGLFHNKSLLTVQIQTHRHLLLSDEIPISRCRSRRLPKNNEKKSSICDHVPGTCFQNAYHCNSIDCRDFIVEFSSTLFFIEVVKAAPSIADGGIFRIPTNFRLISDFGESIRSDLLNFRHFEIVFGEIAWIRPIVQIHIEVQRKRWLLPQFETSTTWTEHQFLSQKHLKSKNLINLLEHRTEDGLTFASRYR